MARRIRRELRRQGSSHQRPCRARHRSSPNRQRRRKSLRRTLEAMVAAEEQPGTAHPHPQKTFISGVPALRVDYISHQLNGVRAAVVICCAKVVAEAAADSVESAAEALARHWRGWRRWRLVWNQALLADTHTTIALFYSYGGKKNTQNKTRLSWQESRSLPSRRRRRSSWRICPPQYQHHQEKYKMNQASIVLCHPAQGLTQQSIRNR